jgi:hypothetical protein
MRRLLALLFVVVFPGLAHAQGATTLSGSELFVTEFTRKVSLGWSDKKSWSDFSTVEYMWSRDSNKAELFVNLATGNNVFVDTDTLHNFQLRGGDLKHGETVQLETTRNNQPLDTGVTWKAEHTYKNYPASWCSDDRSRIDSKFEVGPKEPYTLIVFGKETIVDVVPVVETGWWSRCYSGKRYTRYLVSRDLDAVVSIEHVGFTPQGQAHESSYRFNVKEIKKH